ncbi:MAG: caspase family protein [Sporomusaceae bacterium]|jgi:uncharacterized caspase-like protein|nr:caspase family protein [Sporomusaceae bacterium]
MLSKKIYWVLIITTFFLVSLVCAPTAQADPEAKVYLLAIGIDEYKYLPLMKSCANNAALVASAFAAAVQNTEATLLLNEQATKENIQNKLQEYKRTLNDNDQLLIYYSGHGGKNTMYWNTQQTTTRYQWREENVYDESIMPVYADYNKNTHLTTEELAELLKEFPTKNMVMIIDSSYSEIDGNLTGFLPSFQNVSQTPRPRSSLRDFNMYGITIMNASDWKEVSYEKIFNGKIFGVFTYYLAQGITERISQADTAGSFSLNKVFEYSRMLTMQEVGIQHPQIYRGRNRDLVLFYTSVSKGQVVLE